MNTGTKHGNIELIERLYPDGPINPPGAYDNAELISKGKGEKFDVIALWDNAWEHKIIYLGKWRD